MNDIDIDVRQSSCLKILQAESGLNIVQYKISVEGHAVSEHCYGKTFSGPTSISQESRLSLGPTGLARGVGARRFTKVLVPKNFEKYML